MNKPEYWEIKKRKEHSNTAVSQFLITRVRNMSISKQIIIVQQQVIVYLSKVPMLFSSALYDSASWGSIQ